MRVLIFGGTGFVGSHLARVCSDAGDEVTVASRARGVDVRDAGAVMAAVAEARPDRVFHLAGQASVVSSFGVEEEILRTNVLGTLHVLEAVKEKAPAARVLYVGSAEEYGRSRVFPWREDAPLLPVSPYGVSRAAASLVAQRFALAERLFVVRTRSFNHTGAGQARTYVLPSFVAQLVAARGRGERRVEVACGDLSVKRDFSGVSAVVRAYRALLERGVAGEVYNVCSGVTVSLAELLERVASLIGVEAVPKPDPSRMRPVDLPVLHGDPSKMELATSFSLRDSLQKDLEALVSEVAATQ